MVDVAPLGLKVRSFDIPADVSLLFSRALARRGLNGSIKQLDTNEVASFLLGGLPPRLMESLIEMRDSDPDIVVVVSGIGELPWDDQLSSLVANDYARPIAERQAFLAFRTHWLVAGLFHLLGLRLMKTNVLVRPRPDGKISGPDAHRDMNPISALTTVFNLAPAETQFIDMSACLRALPEDFKQRFLFGPGAHGPSTMTLSEFETRFEALRFLADGRVHALVPFQSNSIDDLARYDTALSTFSLGLTVQPGTVVLWNSLYHRALPPKTMTAPPPSGFSRVALFWGGR